MSIRHAAQPQFPLRGLREGPAAPWVRPADWPGLPWIPDNEQALVGLFAVQDTDNESVAVHAAGAYTVDWGDGTAPQNVATDTVVQHTYNYSTLTSAVTRRGYKTAIIKITPQSGQNLTRIDLQRRPTGFGPHPSLSTPWLDLQVNAASCSQLYLGGGTQRLHMVERVHIRAHAATNLTSLFQFMSSLRCIVPFNTSNVTNITQLCYGCSALNEFPFLDFGNVTTTQGAFRECYSLSTIPALNLVKATELVNFFYMCFSLHRIPAITLGAVTSAQDLVAYCYGLRFIDALDLSLCTTAPSFYYASTLSRCKIVGMKETFSIGACSLSAAAIDEVFTNLATVTGKTVYISDNPGAATCTPSIATSKGWTVVT